MRNAYFVGQINVKDEAKWDEYRSKVPETLAPWGAELVFRGEQTRVHPGGSPYLHIVVIRFASLADAQAWHDSDAYQALVPLRSEAADVMGTTYEA
jgi:uncharacterized protein (DUF1330 family)